MLPCVSQYNVEELVSGDNVQDQVLHGMELAHLRPILVLDDDACDRFQVPDSIELLA